MLRFVKIFAVHAVSRIRLSSGNELRLVIVFVSALVVNDKSASSTIAISNPLRYIAN